MVKLKNIKQDSNYKRKFTDDYDEINKRIKQLSQYSTVAFNFETIEEPSKDFDDIIGRNDENQWLKAEGIKLSNMKNKGVYKIYRIIT